MHWTHFSPSISPRYAIRLLTLVACGFWLTGCISYQSDTERANQAIPHRGILNEIQLGSTTSSWLLDQFGPPQAVRRPDAEKFVWQYQNIATSKKTIRALPLLAISLTDSHTTVYNFEVQNDYVVRYWQEQ